MHSPTQWYQHSFLKCSNLEIHLSTTSHSIVVLLSRLKAVLHSCSMTGCNAHIYLEEVWPQVIKLHHTQRNYNSVRRKKRIYGSITLKLVPS